MNAARRDADERDRELQELVGRTIASKYTVSRLLGRGGMGAVYEAEHIGIGRKVAIKFVDREFAKDEAVVGRFAREARATTAIESEHIVSVLDAGADEGRPFLVMELLRGEDLGSRLRRSLRLPLAHSLHIVAQVLRGLARAHEAGIVHRDLKPDNVFLVRRESDSLFVKIVDFGISKMARPHSGTAPLAITGKGTVLGTPLYMAPEQAQARDDIDGRADIYSAGAILFECLTGRPPHIGETYEQIILAICMQDAPDVRQIVPAVPAGVAQFLARLLARAREARYASAVEALAALRLVAPDEPAAFLASEDETLSLAATVAMGAPTDVVWAATGTPRVTAGRVTRSRRKNGLRVAATALIAMATGVGVTMWWLRVTPLERRDGATSSARTTSAPPPRPSSNRAPPPPPSPSGVTPAPAPTPSMDAVAPTATTPVAEAPPPTDAPGSAGDKATAKPRRSRPGGPARPSGASPPNGSPNGLELQRDFP